MRLFVLFLTIMNTVMRSFVLFVLVNGWNMESSSCSSMAASFLSTARSTNRHHHCHQQKHQQQHILLRQRRKLLLSMVVQQPNTAPTILETVPKQRRTTVARKQSPKGNAEKKIAEAPPAEEEIKKKRKKRTKQSMEELYWRLDSDEVLFHPINNINQANVVTTSTISSSSSSSSSSSPDSLDNNTDSPRTTAASWSLLRFTVRGNPVSLQRHRSTQNGRFSYNPSAPAQESFRNVVQDILSINDNNDNHNNNANRQQLMLSLLQPEDMALAVTLIFRRKRPLNHFMCSKRGPNRLKNTAPSYIVNAGSSSAPTTRASGSDGTTAVSIFQSDIDNLSKFVLDALNGFLYVDDKQIISLTAIKVWDNDDECLGSTSVYIRVLKDQYELESFIRQQQQQQQQ